MTENDDAPKLRKKKPARTAAQAEFAFFIADLLVVGCIIGFVVGMIILSVLRPIWFLILASVFIVGFLVWYHGYGRLW